MEAAVACRAAPDQGPDVFVNKAPLYKPLWGRGAFGGAVLAQALSAAQATVPAGFVADTMHCHFFLAVKPDEPLYSHVERLRDGKSIATRSVRCTQQQSPGKCVFSAVLNFGRTAGRGPRMLQHQPASPVSPATVASIRGGGGGGGGASVALSSTSRVDADCPFESIRVRRGKQDGDGHQRPELQRIVQMTRAKLPSLTSSSSSRTRGMGEDVALHQAALAYMTDNYFLGTVQRVHKAHRFSNRGLVENVVRKLDEGQQEAATDRFKMLAEEELADAASRTGKGGAETTKDTSKASPPKIDMMVSLDHAIFFHNQDEVRADDWMVMEMETPWAGQDRGLVLERIWTADGVLVATCIQEGLFRLSQDAESHL
ncbi:Acyl-coenzyme A thioesterase 8 [Beauveria bassiana]|nr:Acyl-coenzyme A thioesterase 8 [Beauveria bassiana]